MAINRRRGWLGGKVSFRRTHRGGYVYGKKKKTTKHRDKTSKMSKMSKKASMKSGVVKMKSGENARGNAASVRKQSVHKTTGDTKQHLLSKIRHLIAETKLHDHSDVLSRYDVQLKKIRFLINKDIIQISYANKILILLNKWKAKSDLINESSSPRTKGAAKTEAEAAWRALMNKDGWSAFSVAVNIEGEQKPSLLRQESDDLSFV